MITSNWIDSFPENFKWSNATLVCKGMAPYGAVALQEIEEICAALRNRITEPDAWQQEWSRVAERLEIDADTAAAAGRNQTAGEIYLRAGNYFYSAERFIHPGEEKLTAYKRALRCFQEGLKRRHPEIKFADVPYENTSLAAYLIEAPGEGPKPTVVIFNGMDNCKEMSILFAGLEFAKRGINTLAVDGPGQGESLRIRKIFARYDYEVAGKAAFDYLEKNPLVHQGRVAIVGYSMGGYYAPRIAAFDKRYAACVAFGAMYPDFHGWQLHIKRQQSVQLQNSSQSNFQLQFILGISDWEKAMEVAKKFDLRGVAEQVTCPVLVTHGEDDRVVGVDAAHQVFALLKAKKKELKIFSSDEGASQHCQVDDRPKGVRFIADWLEEVFAEV